MVGAQGRPKLAKISKTCLLCDVTSRNHPTENEKRFFSILTKRLVLSSLYILNMKRLSILEHK